MREKKLGNSVAPVILKQTEILSVNYVYGGETFQLKFF